MRNDSIKFSCEVYNFDDVAQFSSGYPDIVYEVLSEISHKPTIFKNPNIKPKGIVYISNLDPNMNIKDSKNIIGNIEAVLFNLITVYGDKYLIVASSNNKDIIKDSYEIVGFVDISEYISVKDSFIYINPLGIKIYKYYVDKLNKSENNKSLDWE